MPSPETSSSQNWRRELRLWAGLLIAVFAIVVLLVVVPELLSRSEGSIPAEPDEEDVSAIEGILMIGPLVLFALIVVIGIGRSRSRERRAREAWRRETLTGLPARRHRRD